MHYTGTIWRPPYEAYSALVQVTAGCTHHKCKFCTLYEDVPFKFRMSPLSEIEEDLKEISRYHRNAKRVFFTGANPFVLSFDKLKTLAGLVCGVLAGRYAAIASAGVASNIRDGMYENIQTFAFSNIDKYSTAGLITRLTTDVTNLQNAYQMIIRMCVRAPISLISALIMALYISAKMGGIFCIAIVFLTAVIAFILWKTIPIFSRVFQKYDDLNASVQENVTAIRVVKSYVREDYEKEKFNKAASLIYKLYVKAESRLALNNPAMMTAMYGCMIAISWVGAKMIVSGSLTTGELTSLFSYVTNILISLMLISMIFVVREL